MLETFADNQLRMTGDRILVKPLEWEPSKILSVVRQGRPLRGSVVAVGPGHHPIKRKDSKDGGKTRRIEYSRHFRRTEVKPGDVIELGGLNQFDGLGYQFPEVLVGGVVHLIVTERDVAMVLEGST